MEGGGGDGMGIFWNNNNKISVDNFFKGFLLCFTACQRVMPLLMSLCKPHNSIRPGRCLEIYVNILKLSLFLTNALKVLGRSLQVNNIYMYPMVQTEILCKYM